MFFLFFPFHGKDRSVHIVERGWVGGEGGTHTNPPPNTHERTRRERDTTQATANTTRAAHGMIKYSGSP